MQKHNHSHSGIQTAPTTQGSTIPWAHQYDMLVKLLTFGKETALRKETIQHAALPSGATVLDVGCGTGTLALLAKAQVGNQGSVYGIDASPEMIQVAQHKAIHEKSDVNFQTGVIEAIDFPDSTFDVVLSSLMFHHLPGDLKKRGLAEIHRVLKPGGRLLIVDIQRPKTFGQRVTMMMMVHQGLTSDVHDLLPTMEKIGYTGIQTGAMRMSSLGFIQGQRSR